MTARSASGLACLTGPPAAGKTVMMQQIVYAAVNKCKAQMDQQGPAPLLPVFMRASVLSSLVSENEVKVGKSEVNELRQLLELFLIDGVQQGIFPIGVEKCILDLYDLDCILICIDGLDEAATHQELVEASIEHAVKVSADSQRRVHVLLSTREHSYVHSRACLRLGDFDVIDLQPLNQARQKQMVEGRIPSAEVDAFCEQLAAMAGRNQELATSPFLLSLMIEVYRKEGKIPSQRVELYEKQVRAIVSRCIQGRVQEEDVPGKLEVATRFLETLAFVCQMRLATRDFQLEACAAYVSELWQAGDAARSESQQLLFTGQIVGLLAIVGDGCYRFNHLTLQEYLAARCAVRLFKDDPKKLLDEFNPAHSHWKREVLQFTTCMLPEEIFPNFCQLLLEMDDGTGVYCELVQDSVRERGPCEAVERMMREQMHKIRGTDLRIAGLCHPSQEMRTLVLSEMKEFRVPSNPFAEGTVTTLKMFAEDTSCVWHTRAASVLSIAQIAQMKHCSHIDRTETIQWMLTMLQSGPDELENIHFALVSALGTLLRHDGSDGVEGDGIVLCPEDENVLFQANLRESVVIADALSDLKVCSKGLVDWLQREPCRIAGGKWPIRHVIFMCKKVVEFKDTARSSRIAESLLGRLHSPSFDEAEWEPLLKCLCTVHKLLGITMPTHILPFLESGELVQRMKVLQACAKLKLGFEDQSLHDLARCLLLREELASGALSTDSLLMHVLEQEGQKNPDRLSSLRESSYVFSFLLSVAEPASKPGGAMETVFSELLNFEMKFEEEKRAQEKKDKERGQKQVDGENGLPRMKQSVKWEQGLGSVPASIPTASSSKDLGDQDLRKNRKRKGRGLGSRQNPNDEQESDDSELYDSGMGEKEEEMQEDEEEPPSLHDLELQIEAYTPRTLDRLHDHSDPRMLLRLKMICYCAAKLWASSGLTNNKKGISGMMMLSDSQSAQARHLFRSLQDLRTPWIQNCGGKDDSSNDRLERAFGEVMQLKTLGRFFFATFLKHVRDQMRQKLGEWREDQWLLEIELQRWEPSSKEMVLERQLLLKEIRVGRRCVELPTWSGHVSHGTREEELLHVRGPLVHGPLTIFPEQKHVAQRLLKRVRHVMRMPENGGSGLESFSHLGFLILVPV